jgi:hypothetical protein
MKQQMCMGRNMCLYCPLLILARIQTNTRIPEESILAQGPAKFIKKFQLTIVTHHPQQAWHTPTPQEQDQNSSPPPKNDSTTSHHEFKLTAMSFSFPATSLTFIRKITSSLRAPTVDPGYPGAVRNLRASGHPGVPPGTGSFF